MMTLATVITKYVVTPGKSPNVLGEATKKRTPKATKINPKITDVISWFFIAPPDQLG